MPTYEGKQQQDGSAGKFLSKASQHAVLTTVCAKDD